MKHTALAQHLRRHGCVLLREGGSHAVYQNTTNGRVSAVPRYAEVSDKLVRKICRDLDTPLPKRT